MALKKIRQVGAPPCQANIYRDVEWGEFRVRLIVDEALIKKADYHTTEKDDAFATAQDMVNRCKYRRQGSLLGRARRRRGRR